MERENLFLTIEQVRKAIYLDLRGYDPQPMLFCEILRTLCGDELVYRREPGKNGLWVTHPGQRRMRWLEGPELIDFMCHIIGQAEPSADSMAAICGLVFQAPCRPAENPDSGAPGVCIQVDMDKFECRQCGQCCRLLAYHDGVTDEDVALLKANGRDDVLKWVRATQTAEGRTTYRIWVTPGSNQFAEPCPFLKHGPSPDRWLCGIQAVKPQICRNYPLNRKHALMTGCKGFDTS